MARKGDQLEREPMVQKLPPMITDGMAGTTLSKARPLEAAMLRAGFDQERSAAPNDRRSGLMEISRKAAPVTDSMVEYAKMSAWKPILDKPLQIVQGRRNGTAVEVVVGVVTDRRIAIAKADAGARHDLPEECEILGSHVRTYRPVHRVDTVCRPRLRIKSVRDQRVDVVVRTGGMGGAAHRHDVKHIRRDGKDAGDIANDRTGRPGVVCMS
ncbi:hypothetical protein OO012_19655 [Rhodobacteraceae bacterium KMM 6894]|nr:hypothetical protein [Rhodobacteraceae bacterium KMM 6894]